MKIKKYIITYQLHYITNYNGNLNGLGRVLTLDVKDKISGRSNSSFEYVIL